MFDGLLGFFWQGVGAFVVAFVVFKSSSSSFYFPGQFIGYPVCHKGKAAGGP